MTTSRRGVGAPCLLLALLLAAGPGGTGVARADRRVGIAARSAGSARPPRNRPPHTGARAPGARPDGRPPLHDSVAGYAFQYVGREQLQGLRRLAAEVASQTGEDREAGFKVLVQKTEDFLDAARDVSARIDIARFFLRDVPVLSRGRFIRDFETAHGALTDYSESTVMHRRLDMFTSTMRVTLRQHADALLVGRLRLGESGEEQLRSLRRLFAEAGTPRDEAWFARIEALVETTRAFLQTPQRQALCSRHDVAWLLVKDVPRERRQELVLDFESAYEDPEPWVVDLFTSLDVVVRLAEHERMRRLNEVVGDDGLNLLEELRQWAGDASRSVEEGRDECFHELILKLEELVFIVPSTDALSREDVAKFILEFVPDEARAEFVSDFKERFHQGALDAFVDRGAEAIFGALATAACER